LLTSGTHRIPLISLIRDQEIPDTNAMHQSKHHQHISITPLDGVEYKDYTGKDFDLIKSWTLYGPAWTREWNSYQNGRGAWLALVAHF
jgi:hypothetical protein